MMKTKLFPWAFFAFTAFVALSCHLQSTNLRENGWYYVLDNKADGLSREPIVIVKDFVELHLDSDGYGTYAIMGRISNRKQQKWASATERSIGKRIAFVFNDSVISAPQVSGRIESEIKQ